MPLPLGLKLVTVSVLVVLAPIACRAGREAQEPIELSAKGDLPPFIPDWELAHGAPTTSAGFPIPPCDPSAGHFLHVRLSQSGSQAILLGTNRAFTLVKGKWSPIHCPPADTVFDLALDGKSGWAITRDSKFFRFEERGWLPAEYPPPPHLNNPVKLCVGDDGAHGWAIGANGDVLVLEPVGWRPVTSLKVHLVDLLCSQDAIVATADSDTGLRWSLSSRLEPPHTPLKAGAIPLWLADGPGAYLSAEKDAVTPTDAATQGGQPIRLRYGDLPISTAWLGSPKTFTSKWLRETNNGYATRYPTGWAANPNGAFYALLGGQWEKDEQASLLTKAEILSIALTSAEDGGWAVGKRSTLLRYRPIPVRELKLYPAPGASLSYLRGEFDLEFPAPLRALPTIFLYSEDRPHDAIELVNSDCKITLRGKRYHLSFNAAALADKFKHELRALEVRADYQHPSLHVALAYRTPKFRLVGAGPFEKATLVTLGVIVFNLLLIAGATRVPLLRAAVLSPMSWIFGAVIVKYVVTDWIIRNSITVKLAIFRDYRTSLDDDPALKSWQGQVYVPPQISIPGEMLRQPIASSEPAWRQVFNTLLLLPRGDLWLVRGESGLGKSALLEHWFGLARELGETPFLIRLGGKRKPQREVALRMEDGDIRVSDKLAVELLVGGGFVLLLDGLDEDAAPEATREFVKKVVKKNLVVLTSQSIPPWSDLLNIRHVALEPFAKQQLAQLLDPSWADEILAKPLLVEVAQLPVTAKLLAAYIRQSGRLPDSRIEIYSSLRLAVPERFRTTILNLEAMAWRVFKTNGDDFAADENLPKDFRNEAVEAGLLTALPKARYRFVHKAIRSYLTACYLDRREARPLADWHKDLTAGLPRSLWIDVVDLWGDIHSRRALTPPADATAYVAFLRQVADFDPFIFASRLYPRYALLCNTDSLQADQEFISWSALVLARTASEHGRPAFL